MNFEIVKYILFVLILAYIPMWVQINLFLSSLGKSKAPVTFLKDKNITSLLLKKAKARIETIKILESKLLFGMMAGIPGRPQLILSRELYKNFNPSELEYVLLHEAGHYKLNHSIKEFLEGVVFFIVGVVVLNRASGFSGVLLGIILGTIFGLLMIQLAKISELEADTFSLKRMDDPKGMITATEKFQKAWKGYYIKNKVQGFLLLRGNPYENRIKMAKEEVERRKN